MEWIPTIVSTVGTIIYTGKTVKGNIETCLWIGRKLKWIKNNHIKKRPEPTPINEWEIISDHNKEINHKEKSTI